MSPSLSTMSARSSSLAHVEEVDDDVVLSDGRREVVKAPPGGFERLKVGIVIDRVEPLADLRVDLVDQSRGRLEHRAVGRERRDVLIHEQRRQGVHEAHRFVDLHVPVVEAQRQAHVARGPGSCRADQRPGRPVVEQIARRLADDSEQLLLHLFGFLS